MIEFDGQWYHDDRMFVLYIARGEVRDRGDGFVDWTIYHREAPEGAVWALVTYSNTAPYFPVFVGGFETREEAEAWKQWVEPAVPRISLGGRPPKVPASYREFLRWKSELCLREYDYTQFYSETGANPREIITLRTRPPDAAPTKGQGGG